MASASQVFGNSRQTQPSTNLSAAVNGSRVTPTQHDDLLPKHEDFCFQRRS